MCSLNPHRFLPRLLAAGLVLLGGCSALRIPQGIQPAPEDWPMHARTASRTGVAARHLVPPLTLLWEADLGSGVGEGSPAVVDSFVVVGTLRGEVLVFNLNTGKRLGGTSFGDAVIGSPVLLNSLAFIPLANSAESMIAYDLRRGEILWKRSCGNIEASPLLLNGRLYAGTTEGGLVCLDTAGGAVLWRFDLPSNTGAKGIRSAPASDGMVVVFGAEDGGVYALDAITGRNLWHCPTGAAVMAAPAVSQGMAFAGNLNGDMVCIELAGGAVRWRRATGMPIHGGAAVAEGLVIFGSTAGLVHALRASDGTVAWVSRVGGVVNVSGLVADSLFYAGSQGRNLVAIRLRDGSVAWKDSLDGRVKTAPAAAGNRLVVVSDNRVLRTYRGVTP